MLQKKPIKRVKKEVKQEIIETTTEFVSNAYWEDLQKRVDQERTKINRKES